MKRTVSLYLLVLFATLSINATAQDKSADLEALYWARQDSVLMNFNQADVDFMSGMIGHHAQALIMSDLAPKNGASKEVQVLAARIINAQKDEIALMQRWLKDRNQAWPKVEIDGLNLILTMQEPAPEKDMKCKMEKEDADHECPMHNMKEGMKKGMKEMDHSKMNHQKKGEKKMDHSKMKDGMKKGMKKMDHSNMELDKKEEGSEMNMDHSGHAGMDHSSMPGMLSQAQLVELSEAKGSEFDRLFLKYMIQHHTGAVTMVDDLFNADGAAQADPTFELASDINVDQTTEIERMRLLLIQLTGDVSGM